MAPHALTPQMTPRKGPRRRSAVCCVQRLAARAASVLRTRSCRVGRLAAAACATGPSPSWKAGRRPAEDSVAPRSRVEMPQGRLAPSGCDPVPPGIRCSGDRLRSCPPWDPFARAVASYPGGGRAAFAWGAPPPWKSAGKSWIDGQWNALCEELCRAAPPPPPSPKHTHTHTHT